MAPGRTIQALLLVVVTTAFPRALASGLPIEKNETVEIKTESPPFSKVRLDGFKDCNEFLHGKLSTIRSHASTWQNGASDCSNCTCYDGDIRCFFHFCNGSPTGYMTPPSSIKESNPDEDVDSEESNFLPEFEESSGFPPDNLNDDEDESNWPPMLLSSVWRTDSPIFNTRPPPPPHSPKTEDGEFIYAGKQDRAENETFDSADAHPCRKVCKKSCPNGFVINPVTGCLKCRCNRCPSINTCEKKCPHGYVHDTKGCQKCSCEIPSTDDDIIYVNEVDEKTRSQQLPDSDDEEILRPSFDATNILNPDLESTKEPCNTTTSNPIPTLSERSRESWSSSTSNNYLRSPAEIKKNHLQELANDENLRRKQQSSSVKDETTIKTVVKDDHSQLLMILIPMGVIFTLVILLSTHYWRRYHRDKYDINSYRPEEKEVLRPVKTLPEEHKGALIRHV